MRELYDKTWIVISELQYLRVPKILNSPIIALAVSENKNLVIVNCFSMQATISRTHKIDLWDVNPPPNLLTIWCSNLWDDGY